MPLTREQSNYINTGGTVFLPSVAIDSTLGVLGNSIFNGNATVGGSTIIGGNSTVRGNTTVGGSSTVVGNATFGGLVSSASFSTNISSIGTTLQLGQQTIIPTSIGTTALFIRGAVGQTANYLRIENSASTAQLTVASDGAVTFVGDVLHNLNSGRFNNISSLWFNSPNTMGTGTKHGYFPAFFIEATSYTPFLIRSQANGIPERKDAITIISDFTNNPPIFQISSTGEISSRSSNRVPLNVRGVRNTGVYQTAINSISGNGSNVTYSNGSVNGNVFEVGATVTITGASTAGFNGTFTITSSTNSDFTVANTATGTSSSATATSVGHTADLVRYTDSANTVVGGINALAQPYSGSTTTVNTQVGGAVIGGTHNGTTATLTLTSASNLAVGDQIVVSGFTPAAYNGRHIVTAVSNTTTFTVSYSSPNPGGGIAAFGIVSTPAQNSIVSRGPATIGQVIRGAASQVANLQEWQSATPAIVASVGSTGTITALSFVKTSGTSAQFLKADGSVDSSTYLTTGTASSTYAPIASPTFTGTVTLAADPTSNLQAATKQYVDSVVASINFHEPVKYSTTAALGTTGNLVGGTITTTYANGTAGVGATLTIATSTNWTAITIDGQSLAVNDRVLIKDQAAGLQNGIYSVTSVGAIGNTTSFVFTRTADSDNSPANELEGGDFTFVLNGTTNAGYGYVCSNTSAITIGTTAITYAIFNTGIPVSAGNGLSESTPGTLTINTGVTVDLNTSQTLTNKTLTSPTINGLTTANATVSLSGTNAPFKLSSPSTAQGLTSGITLYSTFVGTADNGPRRTADIIGGYSGGSWGNEYLSFNVGVGGQNDSSNLTTERMRISGSGNVGIGLTPTAKLHSTTTSTTAYGLISQTPVVGLTAGNTVNMAYFTDARSASNDGIRILNVRDVTSASNGDWQNSSYRIQRNVDSSTYQAEVNFGAGILAFGTQGTERLRLDANGSIKFAGQLLESATVSATAAATTVTYDVMTNENVLYYTSNSTANWTFNVRGSASVTLNSLMDIGQSLTVVFMNTNGTTAYYSTAFQIDGTAVTPKWANGTAPSAGNASSIDIYTYNIIKTAASTYTVLASQSKFA